MPGFPAPFSGDDGDSFDDYDEFVPEHLPQPKAFLTDHTILTGGNHVSVHQTARDLFEERGVYDMTFGYNLARLNLDTRHEDAGFRYAEEDDGSVLRAEFTPTTPFCPQTQSLTIGTFRAWNGLSERHEYDLVRIRTVESHHQSESVNQKLVALESEYRETGDVPGASHEISEEPVTEENDTAPSAGPDVPF